MDIKVVVNKCHGGFNLSDCAVSMIKELGVDDYTSIPRHDPRLVHVVEILGTLAGSGNTLEVETISGSKYIIEEWDGMEHIIDDESNQWVHVF